MYDAGKWIKENNTTVLKVGIVTIVLGLTIFSFGIEQIGSLLFAAGIIAVILSVREMRKSKSKGASPSIPEEDVPLKSDRSLVLLKEGEVLWLSKTAIRYITKNRVVKRVGGYAGASVRAGKVRVGGGGIQMQPVYADVTGTFPGEFALTNQRIVFIAAQHGFEYKLDKVSAISHDTDGKVIISTPQDTCVMHIFANSNIDEIKKMQTEKRKKKISVIYDADAVLMDMISQIKEDGQP